MAGWSRPSMVPIPEERAGLGAQPLGSTTGRAAGGATAGRRGERVGRVAGGRGPRPIRPGRGAPVIGRPGERRDQAGLLLVRTCRVQPSRVHPSGRPRRQAGLARPRAARLPDRRVILRRRAVALLGVGLAALLAVVALGLLAAGARSATVPRQNVSVQVAPGESLWQIARRTAPAADPDAVVERIVAQNGLSSASVGPGQVLSVPSGSAG